MGFNKGTRETRASELVPEYASEIVGKTILITGPSDGGLGDVYIRQIAVAEPGAVILAGRTQAKFQKLIDWLNAEHPEIKVKPLPLVLTSFASVRKAAETVNSWSDIPNIDVFVCNAGTMGTPFSLTEDGIESQFQTSHLGHFLLTNLVMDKILASPKPRVVVVSSNGHRMSTIRWTDYNFNNGEHYDRWTAYGQAKTANNLMALGLANRLGARGLTAFSLHPGVILGTGLSTGAKEGTNHDDADMIEEIRKADVRVGSKIMWPGDAGMNPKDPDQGVATHVFASFDTGIDNALLNGSHLADSRLADPYKEEVWAHARDGPSADMLWTLSEKLVGQQFRY